MSLAYNRVPSVPPEASLKLSGKLAAACKSRIFPMSSRAMLIAIATSKDLKNTKGPDGVKRIGWCGGGVL